MCWQLPVSGAISDLIDTLLLRGIDLAVVPADVLEFVERREIAADAENQTAVCLATIQ